MSNLDIAEEPAQSDWAITTQPPPLHAGEIHVWRMRLNPPPDRLSQLAGHLCPDERIRAARFHFPLHRDRFIAGRAQLREVLAHYVPEAPGELRFAYGASGKPALLIRDLVPNETKPDHRTQDKNAQTAEGDSASVHFNLAHSDDLALLAITSVGPIGIDIERIRVMRDAKALVNRFFSAREAREYAGVPEDQSALAFFNLWTRKEAFLKATGQGIPYSLNKVEVSFLPGQPARLLALPEDASIAEWHLAQLAPATDFAAAFAVRGCPSSVRCWSWESSRMIR